LATDFNVVQILSWNRQYTRKYGGAKYYFHTVNDVISSNDY